MRAAILLAILTAWPAQAADTDGDGVPDNLDNCTLTANPSQCDSNGDGYGNACDGDLDNNGATNAADVVILRSQLGSTGPDADLNCNGYVNAQDRTIQRALLGKPPGPSGLHATGAYSTTFGATEFPISENGRWHRSPNAFTSVRTASGHAYGTNGPANTYDDSYALLSGFGANYTAEATIYRSASLSQGITHEVELLMRASDNSQNALGYECLFNYGGGAALMRWDGGVGDYYELPAQGSYGYGRQLQTGDKVKCTASGSTLRSYINGTLMLTATDTRYPAGQPGISFFTRPGGNSANFAFDDYTVTEQ